MMRPASAQAPRSLVPIMPRVSAQARVPQELLATSPPEAADGDVDIVATLTPTGDLLPSRHPRLGACYAALVFSAIALYTLAAALLTVVPGPDNALLLRNALRGRSYALASAAGCAIGLVCWGLVAAFGLTALVTASRVGYNVLRVAGAVYLVWRGLRMWRSAGAEAVGFGNANVMPRPGSTREPSRRGDPGAQR
jgi:hypothetical protein